jgi:hypothetical protein
MLLPSLFSYCSFFFPPKHQLFLVSNFSHLSSSIFIPNEWLISLIVFLISSLSSRGLVKVFLLLVLHKRIMRGVTDFPFSMAFLAISLLNLVANSVLLISSSLGIQ